MIDPDNLRKCAADKSVCGAGRYPCVFEDELRSAADEIEQLQSQLTFDAGTRKVFNRGQADGEEHNAKERKMSDLLIRLLISFLTVFVIVIASRMINYWYSKPTWDFWMMIVFATFALWLLTARFDDDA